MSTLHYFIYQQIRQSSEIHIGCSFNICSHHTSKIKHKSVSPNYINYTYPNNWKSFRICKHINIETLTLLKQIHILIVQLINNSFVYFIVVISILFYSYRKVYLFFEWQTIDLEQFKSAYRQRVIDIIKDHNSRYVISSLYLLYNSL